jgi:hypothetical protein
MASSISTWRSTTYLDRMVQNEKPERLRSEERSFDQYGFLFVKTKIHTSFAFANLGDVPVVMIVCLQQSNERILV